MDFLEEIREASDVSMVEIMYGEIEDGIKEELNPQVSFVALGNDYPSDKFPVSVHPSLEQGPEGGIDVELACMYHAEDVSFMEGGLCMGMEGCRFVIRTGVLIITKFSPQ